MSDFIYDYSWSRPDPAALGAGVIRYLCPPSNGLKRLTKAELNVLHAAGKPVGLVWEATADSSSWDGAEADRQADALGFPDSTPIYFAQDAYVNPATYDMIAQRLAAQPTRRPKGLYAGAPLVQHVLDAGIAAYGWIAGALSWSMSPPYSVAKAVGLAPGAHLIQLVNTDVPGTDANTVLKPSWGGWHPDHAGDQPVTDDEIEKVAARAAALVWAYPGNNQVDPNNPHPNQSSIVSDAHFESHTAAVTVAALNAKIDALTNAVAKIQTTSTGPTTGDLNVTGTLHVQGT